MKKYTILLLLFLLLPIKAFAQSYNMTGTDVTIDFNDDWIVLTRDNYNDEELLASLNLTYDYMHSVFMDNDAYLDAFKYWDDTKKDYVEVFVIMNSDGMLDNLNYLEDDEIIEDLKKLPEYAAADLLEIYKNDNSKFVYTEYTNSGLYLCNYFTVINGDTYIFKFQSSVKLDDAKKAVIKDIMSTAKFDYELDDGGKDNKDDKKDTPPADTSKKNNNNHSILIKGLIGGLIGAVAGGVCGFIVFLIKKGKKKDTETDHYNPYGNKKDDDDKNNKFINY